MFKLSEHHGSVLVLVIELQALDEVLKGSSVLGLLNLGVDRIELLQLDELLALLLCPAQFVNGLEGGVEVEASEAVPQVEEVHAGFALKVVDVEGKLGPCVGG